MRRDELMALGATLGGRHRLVPPRQLGRGPAGVYLGDRQGQSVDFHDYREYHPGDDLRRVDWRAFARTGQMSLKLFREEVSPVVEVILDASASMTAYPGKAEAAVFLAAFLGEAARAAGGRPVLCRNGERFAGRAFAPALADTAFAGEDSPRAARGNGGGRSMRFFLSDCLFPDGVGPRFAALAAGGLTFRPLLILSRSEREPPWRGAIRLVDAEGGGAFRDLLLDGDAVTAYRERLARHEEALSLEATRHGGSLLALDVPDAGLDKADCEGFVASLAAEGVATAV